MRFHDLSMHTSKYVEGINRAMQSGVMQMGGKRKLYASIFFSKLELLRIVSEYGQEIPQSQTADNPWHHEEEPLYHHETPGRQIKRSNQLSLPHQDDCNTRMGIK